jgi:putative phosphoesterase
LQYSLATGKKIRHANPLVLGTGRAGPGNREVGFAVSMRILLLADIHANWPALKAVVDEPFDVCLVLGDLVDYGLEPAPCIDWVRKHATHAIRGNHDHCVAQQVRIAIPAQAKHPYKYLSGVTRAVTQERLSSEDRRFLGALPVTSRLTLENTRFLLAHGTPRDPLDEYGNDNAQFWERRLQDVDADVICVGHTHHPYVLEVDNKNKLVINPGSVGQPRDGDPRASYAVIENGRVELKRVEYPVEDTVRNVLESGLPEPAKALLVEVFRTGGLAKPDSGKLKGEPPSGPLTGA